MFKKGNHILIILLLICVSITSCVNLQHVNTFATSSAKSLANNVNIGYSFTQHCYDFECTSEIYHVPKSTAEYTVIAPCNKCDIYKKADKALNVFNNVLAAYLTGLAQLSDKKAVNFDLSDLVKAINAGIKPLSITPAEITSAGKIGSSIGADLLNFYRKKQLKKIITNSSQDFDVVITAYIRCMDTNFKDILLESDLNILLPNLYSSYYQLNNKLLSPYENSIVYEQYLNKRKTFEQYKTLTEKYVEALKKIKDGYDNLSSHLGDLSKDDIKDSLFKYAIEIQEIVTDFNVIKNSNVHQQ